MSTVEQEDLDANASLFQQQQTTPLLQRFSLEGNRELIPPDQYRKLVRGLNTKQRQIVNFHRRWCKDAVISMKGKPTSLTECLLVVLVELEKVTSSHSYAEIQ